ncbi:MAG: hypothetical protein UZ22_OP11002000592 [Microgenomates bacterium OLB23]|nr:MAG: hypothetical protein UZ22_OP11002000592 [Microgenomates bacterium OLB23]
MKNTKKRVLLVSPYLDVLGGGEQHIFSILKVFDDHGYTCDIVWKNEDILQKLQETHNTSFSHAQVIPHASTREDYSHCLYVTDGSYFFSKAQRNYIFFMYPKTAILPTSLLNKLKTRSALLFANGEFTAEKIRKKLHRRVEVIHPYIDESFFYEASCTRECHIVGGQVFSSLAF